jgi:hypothetical protein
MVKVIVQYKMGEGCLLGEERQYDGQNILHSAGSVTTHIIGQICDGSLKVLTNEKRGGLTVVSFDRSHFKLFSRKFSNKMAQAPSSERPLTA